MKQRKEVIEEWLRMVEEEPSRPLNQYEQSFITNIRDDWDRTGFLTDAQIDVLETIYATKTS